ncbi:ABC transporter ATP-binding protein [Amycolatopsis acidicola]|uniref:ABC-type quaternary amine transporter n=1 Tax=Amycolatopsis acidicola TaxID=2596893 RepID=A0A5N0V120_9PSEU|nr:ABC transporter ATP-binding protein [Amycolatopsis acidicola]KAA9160086.1 ABC transporter ATP-binding protein [Amycolatopsis acidicola]
MTDHVRTAGTEAEAPAKHREESHLEVTGLTRDYGDGGVRDATFSVRRGQLLTLLGPSGCGKTTTLRCLAGIEVPDAGTVRLGGRLMTSAERRVHLRPSKRDIGMVFQSYALWPHLSVFENVAFPLRMRGAKTAAIRPRVEEMLNLVGLDGMSGRQPGQLSGGQQQRVALARALVYRPGLLLLDEPLSNLDAARRDSVRRDIGRLQRELGITAVYVTHDQDEAMMLSDRIVVMRDGRIVQDGTPAQLLAEPASLFVAKLLGQTNIIEGVFATETTESDVDGRVRRMAGIDVALPHGVTRLFARVAGEAKVGEPVSLVWRPGDLLVEEGESAGNALPGTVEDVRIGSSLTDYTVDVGVARIRVFALGKAPVPVGTRVTVSCAADRALCLSR